MKDLAIILPTNDYELLNNYFMKNLENLASAKDRIEIVFNLQNFTDEQVKSVQEACDKVGLDWVTLRAHYEIKQKGHTPYNAIRQDTADMRRSAKYYCLMDDDMILLDKNKVSDESIGDQLIKCLDYLDNHPDCGSIVLDDNSKQGTKKSEIIVAPIDYKCYVVNGLILRNIMYGDLVPRDAYNLVGRGEDMLAVAARLAQGYYPARLSYTSILHSENHSFRPKPDKVQPSYAEIGWKKSDEIAESNNYGYIRDHYNPDFSCKSGDFNIISKSRYESARTSLLKELHIYE